MTNIATDTPIPTLREMMEEVRLVYPKTAAVKNDYDCMWEFADNYLVAKCTPNGLDLPEKIDSCPKTLSFLQRAAAKRQKFLLDATADADSQFTRFKERLTKLIETDSTLKECAETGSIEFSIGADMVNDMMTIVIALGNYHFANSSEEKAKVLEKTSEALVVCLGHILRQEDIPESVFASEIASFKPTVQKLASIFKKVNPELRQSLVEQFKAMMKAILTVFNLYRFPVIVQAGFEPVYLGKFIPIIMLKPYMDLVGLKLAQCTIYP